VKISGEHGVPVGLIDVQNYAAQLRAGAAHMLNKCLRPRAEAAGRDDDRNGGGGVYRAANIHMPNKAAPRFFIVRTYAVFV